MRKTLAIVAFGVLVSGSAALAADPDVGCGWGTMAFKGQTGVAPKVLAATTNGFLGNQTFGISSGTLGCNKGGVVKAEVQLNMYAGANIDKLASDMAAGNGESLATLAHLIGVSDADKPAFFHLTKAHFGELFPADEMTAGQMLITLKALMADDQQLAKYVS
jgi:hypothetical protein